MTHAQRKKYMRDYYHRYKKTKNGAAAVKRSRLAIRNKRAALKSVEKFKNTLVQPAQEAPAIMARTEFDRIIGILEQNHRNLAMRTAHCLNELGQQLATSVDKTIAFHLPGEGLDPVTIRYQSQRKSLVQRLRTKCEEFVSAVTTPFTAPVITANEVRDFTKGVTKADLKRACGQA